MNRLLKTLLIWILMLALPAQALGSVIKLSCGPTHHARASMNISVPQHPHHGMESATAHHHDIADDANKADASAKSSVASPEYQSATCSACATCCSGAAVMHSPLNWTPSYRNSFIAVTSVLSSFTGHIPAGLERPPRLLLA